MRPLTQALIMVAAVGLGVGAAAEKDTPRLEGSFCDYWPLAVGNQWARSDLPDMCWLTYTITDKFLAGGCEVYEFTREEIGDWGSSESKVYMAFVGGWAVVTPEWADTASLPALTGSFYPSMPEVFKSGNPITLRFDWLAGNAYTPAPVTPTVTDREIVLVAGFLTLVRGHGMSFPLSPINENTIVGGCGGIFDATIEPPRRWYQVGGPLDFRVLLPGTDSGLNYQWLKNGTSIPDQTDAQLAFIPQTEQDNGVYSCVISDDAKAFHETEGVSIQLLPAGSLPVAGAAGILLMFAGCVASARRYCRRS